MFFVQNLSHFMFPLHPHRSQPTVAELWDLCINHTAFCQFSGVTVLIHNNTNVSVNNTTK